MYFIIYFSPYSFVIKLIKPKLESETNCEEVVLGIVCHTPGKILRLYRE